MPLIEELPTTAPIKASHGWAYVPDTGPIAAQQPGTRDRKRTTTTAASSRAAAATASAKQQKAIQARLDSLNKENYRDGVTVPLPQRAGAGSSTKAGSGRKMTSNVRRILTYQRGFAHYLADEEANNPGGVTVLLPAAVIAATGPTSKEHGGAVSQDGVAVAGSNVSVNVGATGKRRSVAGRGHGRGGVGDTTSGSATPDTVGSTPQKRGRKRGRPSKMEMERDVEMEEAEVSIPTPAMAVAPGQVKVEEQEQDHRTPGNNDNDTLMTDTDIPDTNTSQTQTHNPTSDSDSTRLPPASSAIPTGPPTYPAEWDDDPLLASTVSEVPRMPSERIMQLLISELPLTYNAARAKPLEPDKQLPPRRFCGMCGYWGKVKCRKCGEWSCGLMACWRGHEGICPLANAF